jgi:hypothetical protein
MIPQMNEHLACMAGGVGGKIKNIGLDLIPGNLRALRITATALGQRCGLGLEANMTRRLSMP